MIWEVLKAFVLPYSLSKKHGLKHCFLSFELILLSKKPERKSIFDKSFLMGVKRSIQAFKNTNSWMGIDRQPNIYEYSPKIYTIKLESVKFNCNFATIIMYSHVFMNLKILNVFGL